MRKIIYFFLRLFLVGVLLYSCINIFVKVGDYKEDSDNLQEIQLLKENSYDNYESALYNINQDYNMWIKVDNTNIDYPVVQHSDNEYYLYNNFRGEKSISGSIFLDYRVDFLGDQNPIIYGHNMKNKTMFSQLEKFKKEDFFRSNNKVRLYQNNQEYVYEVFSVYYTSPSFNYTTNKFGSDEDYSKYLNKIINKSLFKSNIKVNIDDKILTLSTCSYEAKNYRTVVHAKLISKDL